MKDSNRKARAVNSRSRRQGSVTLMVAVGLIMILGFAALSVDYGVLTNDVNQLQRAADAAALAGSQDLPDEGKAKQKAIAVAGLNGVPNTSPTTVVAAVNGEGNQITVTTTRNRPLFFARVLGVSNKQLSRSATAGKTGAATPQIVPIGITQGMYQSIYGSGTTPTVPSGGTTTITFVDHKKASFENGNFLLYDLRSVDTNAKSPEHMKRQLEGTESVSVSVGGGAGTVNENFDKVDALNGAAQKNKFMEGMATRFQLAAGSPWFDAPSNPPGDYLDYVGQHYQQIMAGTEPKTGAAPFAQNPRIMDLIVTTAMGPGGGNTDQPILDFAPVYVERVVPTNKGIQLVVRFLPKSLSQSAGSGGNLVQ